MIDLAVMKIILASGSPRRSKLLADMGYEFRVIPPDLPEENIPGESPEDHVRRLALMKAMTIARQNKDDLVIGADTVVVLDDAILGKPPSPEEAVEMLRRLSSRTHTVYTGLALVLLSQNITRTEFDSTSVTFNRLDENSIGEYVDSGEPLDKAGAYGIQGMGSFLVKEYIGQLDTVIGFPSELFRRIYTEVVSCLNR